MMAKSQLVVLALLVAVALVRASEGDRDDRYIRCVWTCHRDEGCQGDGGASAEHVWDRLVRWGCSDQCRYQCQQQLTRERLRRGEPLVQFHGKWPFRRLLGMQEALSVAFSLLNMLPPLAGVLGVVRARLELGRKGAGHAWMWASYAIYGVTAVHSWLWSVVFHTRDLPATEWADHMAATAFAMVAATCALVRLANRRVSPALLWAACALLLALHARSMWPSLHFHYNLLVAGASFGVGTIAWGLHAARRGAGWRALVASQAIGWAAVGLELGDFFFPRLALDAHASWHAATIVPSILVWCFIAADLRAAVPPHLRPAGWRRGAV